ncbi:MAG: hypothetical protein ACFBSG_09965 [Leptolyngbyaceae cyanobacterium]
MNSRLRQNRGSQKSLSRATLSGTLAIALGLMSVACSKGGASQSQVALMAPQAETTLVADDTTVDMTKATPNAQQAAPADRSQYAEVGNDGEPNEPLTANIERLNLEPGTPYGEVRSLVMAEGWMPYTPAEGSMPDFNDPAVRELHAQGFEEAETCSGTG